MKFPDKFDVLIVHATLIAETGGTNGLRAERVFESALAAAENRHHYEDADALKGCGDIRLSLDTSSCILRRQQTIRCLLWRYMIVYQNSQD